MFILLGITILIAASGFLYWFFIVKDREQSYIDYSNDYPIWHWKFILIRYKVSYIKWTSLILFLLGLSIIIVQFV